MYYYLTTPADNGSMPQWHRVDHGPFASKAELAVHFRQMLESISDWESAVIALQYDGTAATQRVRNGRSLRREWITARGPVTEAKDPKLAALIKTIREQYDV